MDDVGPTPVEREAILLRFRAQNPDAPVGAAPTPEQEVILLKEIHEREAVTEQSALEMLHRATTNSPTYSGDRSKYMQLFFLITVGLSVVIFVLLGIARLGLMLFSIHGR